MQVVLKIVVLKVFIILKSEKSFIGDSLQLGRETIICGVAVLPDLLCSSDEININPFVLLDCRISLDSI